MKLEDITPNELQRALIRAVLEGHLPLAVRAGIGSGKTLGIALLLLILSRVVPDARVLVVMKTQRNLKRNLMPACRALFKGRARWVARDDTWLFNTGFTAEMTHYNVAEGADEAENPLEGADMWLVIFDEGQMLDAQALAHGQQRARQRVVDVSGRVRQSGVIVLGRPASNEWYRPEVQRIARGLGRDPANHVLSFMSYVNLHNLSPDWVEQQRATLTEEQFIALIEAGEMPTEGAVFRQWSLAHWPDGNVWPNFRYDPARETWAAIDLGRGSPHVLFIQPVEAEAFGRRVTVDVAFDELAPTNVTTPELAALIREMAWRRPPRNATGAELALAAAAPYTLDGVVCDPAGHQVDRHTGLSDIGLLTGSPLLDTMPGLGVPVHAPTSPERRATRARVERLQALICAADGVRRFAVTPRLAEAQEARQLAKALQVYTHDDIRRAETRSKRHRSLADHAVDTAGYWVVEKRWHIRKADALRRPVVVPRVEPRWKRYRA